MSKGDIMPEAVNAAPDKKTVRLTSFDAFMPEDIDVRLEFDDHIEIVPMRTLSYGEFQRIGRDVPIPTPPIMGAGKNGPIYDYNDAGYRQQVQDAEMQRTLRRLLASLRVPVPGGTVVEQVAVLQNSDANRLRMLISAMVQLAAGGEASVESRAATFQQG